MAHEGAWRFHLGKRLMTLTGERPTSSDSTFVAGAVTSPSAISVTFIVVEVDMKTVLSVLPKPDANGRFPASAQCTRVSLARNIIRDRKSVGLSQERFVELAGIRQEAISRFESGTHMATLETIAKSDQVIATEAGFSGECSTCIACAAHSQRC